jgi:hypothetical protein
MFFIFFVDYSTRIFCTGIFFEFNLNVFLTFLCPNTKAFKEILLFIKYYSSITDPTFKMLASGMLGINADEEEPAATTASSA